MKRKNITDPRITELYREAEKLSKERKVKPSGPTQSNALGADSPDMDAEIAKQIEDFAHEIHTKIEGLSATSLDELKKHPLLVAAAALALGVVIGRLTK
jgi:hypothetical protein